MMTTGLKYYFLVLILLPLSCMGQQWLGLFPWGASSSGNQLVPPTNAFVRIFPGPFGESTIPQYPSASSFGVTFENFVWDSASTNFVGTAEDNGGPGGLLYTNPVNPTIASDWGFFKTNGGKGGNGTHLVYCPSNGLWYEFFGGNTGVFFASNHSVLKIDCSTNTLAFPGHYAGWDSNGCHEPYVFQRPTDGRWIAFYLGKNANNGEAIGEADSAYIDSGWTTNVNNPIIVSNSSASYDHYFIGDPWCIWINGNTYVGYAAVPDSSDTSCATAMGYFTNSTFTNFIKTGVILSTNKWGWDYAQVFRGAARLYNRLWVLPYCAFGYSQSASTTSTYTNGIATSPADFGAPTFVGNVSISASDLSSTIYFTNDINSCAGVKIGTSAGTWTSSWVESYQSNLWHTVTVYGLSPSTTYYVLPMATNMISTAFAYGAITSFTTTSTNTDTTCIGRWLMTNGSGSVITDSSGNVFNGATVNSPTWIAGHGLTFNGSTQNATFTTNNVGLSNFTFSVWIKTTTSSLPSSVYGWWGKSYAGSAIGRWTIFQDAGLIYAYDQDTTGNFETAGLTETPYIDGNWHNFLVTFQRYGYGNTAWQINVIADGILQQFVTFAGPGLVPSNFSLNQHIYGAAYGSASDTPEFYSAMSEDDARLFNRALSPTEALNLFRGGRQ